MQESVLGISNDLSFSILIKLLISGALGAVVGLERELRQKPAGLRTNMFICAGSALFTLLSFEIAWKFGGDPVRIAAQLIPGIGFIGAGAIIREHGSVAGLTTAATIFLNAGVGMAVGAGYYLTAAFTTLMALGILVVIGWMERTFTPRAQATNFRLTGPTLDAFLPGVQRELADLKIAIERVRVRRVGSDYVFEFDTRATAHHVQELFRRLASLPAHCEMGPTESSRNG